MVRRLVILMGLVPALIAQGPGMARSAPAPFPSVGDGGSGLRPSRQVVAVSVQRVRIVDFAFRPRAVTVSKGTRVRWVNRGNTAHTSTSNSGLWDSGPIAPGSTFSRVFRKRGTFKFHCSIHPGMKGRIVVT